MLTKPPKRPETFIVIAPCPGKNPRTTPPTNAPAHAVANTRPNGKDTPKINGSPIPKIPAGRPPIHASLTPCSFLYLANNANAAPT